MKYTVHFLNGNKLSLDEGNYKRLKDPRRSMAGPLYAPMKDGEAIFFRNILMVVPEDVKIKEDSWRDSPHVVRFIDGLTIGLSDIERKSVERSLRDTSNKKFVLLRNGVLIYHNLVWFIAHRGSEWLKDDKESEPVLPGKLPKVPPKSRFRKTPSFYHHCAAVNLLESAGCSVRMAKSVISDSAPCAGRRESW